MSAVVLSPGAGADNEAGSGTDNGTIVRLDEEMNPQLGTTADPKTSRARNTSKKTNSHLFRNPNAPDALDCVVLGKNGIYTRALYVDVQALIRAYEENDCIDYPTFASIWREQKFFLIHFACGERNTREQFMCSLFNMFLDVLSSAETLPAQVGAVYGLYLLYFTQPKNFKKVAIRLTIAAWQNLELLYKLGFDYSATDLIFIIHKLRDRGAFMYVAQNEKISKALMNENDDLSERAERTLVRLEREMNNSVLVPVDGPLKQFSELATEYHNAKVELIDVSLAKRASEMVMAHLCRIKPPDLDLATAKPRPAFLREKHAPTSPSPTQFKAGSTTGRFVDTDGDNAREATATSNTDIEMTEASSSSREPLTGPTPASSVRAVASSSSVSRRQGPGPRQPYTRPHVSQTESNPDDGKVTRKREMSKKKKRILPNVFPLSMLQASTPYFADQIDDVVRRYFKDRLSRFEFAVGDGLSRNDYKFPTQPLSKRRGRAFPITSGLELELEIHGIRNIQEPDERDMRLLEVMKNRRKQIAERRKGKKTSSNTAGSGTDKGANTDTDEHDVEHPVEGAGERDQVHGLELRGTKSPECDAEGNSLDKRERDAESTNLDERERGDEHKLD